MTKSSNSENRRRAVRRASSKKIALLVESEHPQISSHAFAVDLSELGARIRASTRLEPGQSVTVIPREGKAYAVPSRVIWVSDSHSGESPEVGLAFLEPQAVASPLLADTQ